MSSTKKKKELFENIFPSWYGRIQIFRRKKFKKNEKNISQGFDKFRYQVWECRKSYKNKKGQREKKEEDIRLISKTVYEFRINKNMLVI